MGRSAKVHKRPNKKTALSGSSGPSHSRAQQTQVQTSKKKAGLKDKTKGKGTVKAEGGVLGGADYVSLMMGGRRKARQEAGKLPRTGDE